MKKLILLMGLLSLTTSCEVQDTAMPSDTAASPSTDSYTHRSIAEMPRNSDNPFDYTRILFDELLQEYYLLGPRPTNVNAISLRVESLAHSNAGFLAIKSPLYQNVSSSRVSYLVREKLVCLPSVLEGTGMSIQGKSSLYTFIQDYANLCDSATNYESIYDFTTSYESTILSSATLPDKDKQILLTTASIARHSANIKRKRPKKNTDPAWDLLICTLYGAADSAGKSPAEAVTMAVASGIVENE